MSNIDVIQNWKNLASRNRRSKNYCSQALEKSLEIGTLNDIDCQKILGGYIREKFELTKDHANIGIANNTELIITNLTV